jgi:hypothetical protein
MRRLEYLINQVRRSTDNNDTQAIKDVEIIEYFNDGVKAIQALIHAQNYAPDLFLATQEYSFDGSLEYNLPSDIYSTNAIMLVEVRFGQSNVNQGYRPVKRITDHERVDFFGYFIRDGKIIMALTEGQTNIAFDQFRLTYFRKLKRFDKRWATVSSVTPGSPNTLILTGNVDEDLQYVDDKISIVDSSGAVIQAGLQVVSYAGLPASLTYTGNTANIASGQYVVCGDLSTTLTELPDSVEPYLLDYVRQRLYTRQNYNDAEKQMGMSQQSQQALLSIFSNKSRDPSDPPITDIDFLGY